MKKEKNFYSVYNAYYDNGKVVAYIADMYVGEEKPSDSFKRTLDADIYIDWFDNVEAAKQWIEDAKNA